MVTQERNAFATDSTLTELVADIAYDMRELATAHAVQIKTELRNEAASALLAGIWLGAGAIVVWLGLVSLLLGLGAVLVEVWGWPVWGAAFLVGGITAGSGIVLAVVGYKKLANVSVVPEQSLKSIEESLTCLTNSTI
jgi:hypothetical protein